MRCAILIVMVVSFTSWFAPGAWAGDWPGWRGPDGRGVSQDQNVATQWSSDKNITWKAPMPGPGNSSPIVWGDRVFATCALDAGKKRALICFNRADGKVLWQKEIVYSQAETTHKGNPYCSATPVTDGKSIFVSQGSAGVAAYNFAGKLLWHRDDLGPLRHIWGNAASPVLFKNTVIQMHGPGTEVSLVAMDKQTGKTVWRRKLKEAASKNPKEFFGSWATPVIRDNQGRSELLIGLPKHIRALDPETGKNLWQAEGLGPLVYTDALFAGKVVMVLSGYHGPSMGVEAGPGVTGKLGTQALWRITDRKQLPQRVGSGVVVGEHVYILDEDGQARCFEIMTGKTLWREKVGRGKSWGTMVAADGKLYVTNMQGQTLVLEAAPQFKLLSINELEETTRATPAIADSQVFIRTYKHLYCIGTQNPK